MSFEPLRLRTRIRVPRLGEAGRWRVGTDEWLVEASRGCTTVLWHAGREARRYVLGLPRDGFLELVLAPPAFAVHVQVRETMALAPHTRIRGYVQVPLTPRLDWIGDDGEASPLLDFPPEDLGTEWQGEAIVHTCVSPWFARFPAHGADARVMATVPVHVRNTAADACSPHHLPISLAATELRELRQCLVAAPRRLSWNGSAWQTTAPAGAEVLP